MDIIRSSPRSKTNIVAPPFTPQAGTRRILFLIYALLVVGYLAYTLSPKLAERDCRALNAFRADNSARSKTGIDLVSPFLLRRPLGLVRSHGCERAALCRRRELND
jgi:hypothetical protein